MFRYSVAALVVVMALCVASVSAVDVNHAHAAKLRRVHALVDDLLADNNSTNTTTKSTPTTGTTELKATKPPQGNNSKGETVLTKTGGPGFKSDPNKVADLKAVVGQSEDKKALHQVRITTPDPCQCKSNPCECRAENDAKEVAESMKDVKPQQPQQPQQPPPQQKAPQQPQKTDQKARFRQYVAAMNRGPVGNVNIQKVGTDGKQAGDKAQTNGGSQGCAPNSVVSIKNTNVVQTIQPACNKQVDLDKNPPNQKDDAKAAPQKTEAAPAQDKAAPQKTEAPPAQDNAPAADKKEQAPAAPAQDKAPTDKQEKAPAATEQPPPRK